ncbi:Protein of unknown function [Ruminococcus flavefaciens]|uniref:DUF4003 domain-containing protein n=1 Tax=Ruminococcus flavefaciens TaxID=1265 RepID=A0A1H6KN28_RUMFL|nr:DUF4003 family protein [Ruminococcus flavefaciens]SEH75159.1 Protein of unknown function [Ruminococcus flavefaciens]
MKENIKQITMDFIENRDIIKKAVKMESTYIYPVAANVFCAAGVKADEDKLKECKKIIKKNAGFASYLKGNVMTVLAAKLCVSPDPEAQFKKVMDIYGILKEHFSRSEYLAMLATLLAEKTTTEEAERIAARGRALYDMMKKEHPILTSSEDNVMAGFMALSEKNDKQLIDDAESCYDLLRKEFSDKNAMQTVSHILAMTDGAPEEKVDRMVRMFDMFKKAGRKFGKHEELPMLAAISVIEADEKELVDTAVEIDDLLSEQKGYGTLSLSKRIRLMHAAMLTADLYNDYDNALAAVSASAIAIIAANEAAMYAAIAVSASASNNAN